jgi:hypothetical protein
MACGEMKYHEKKAKKLEKNSWCLDKWARPRVKFLLKNSKWELCHTQNTRCEDL